jgi:hypothetical protein
MEEEFFCVFTERGRVPSLFDCVHIPVQITSLDKPGDERESAASETPEVPNYTKHLVFCAGRRLD